MMPMIFAEHERKRFMDASEYYNFNLRQKSMDLEQDLENEKARKRRALENGKDIDDANRPSPDDNSDAAKRSLAKATETDCESTRLWLDVSALKVGMESFRKVLVAIGSDLETLRSLEIRPQANASHEKIGDSMFSERINRRLKEMTAELDGRIRTLDGLLTGLARASEVVSSDKTTSHDI
jgi:hypothetical protein